MPLAFLGAIGGFFRGLIFGLAVLAAAIVALTLFGGPDSPSPESQPVASAPAPAPTQTAPADAPTRTAAAPAAAPEAPIRTAAAPASALATPTPGENVEAAAASMDGPGGPMPGAIGSFGDDSGFIARPGAETAPVASPAQSSRVNSAALAALNRSGRSDSPSYAASAPRPTFGAGQPVPGEAVAAFAPDAGAMRDRERTSIRSALSRPTASRMAAVETDSMGGGQALSAVTGIRVPTQRAGAGAEAGLPPMSPTAGLGAMTPRAPGALPGTTPGQPIARAPGLPGGDRMAALTPPGGAIAPGMAPRAPGGALAAPGNGFGAPAAPGGGFGAPTAPGGAPVIGGMPALAPGSSSGVSPFAPTRRSPGLAPAAPSMGGMGMAPGQRTASLGAAATSTIAPVRSVGMAPSSPGIALPTPAVTNNSAPRPSIGGVGPGAAPAPAVPLETAVEPEIDEDARLRLAVYDAVGVPLPVGRPGADDRIASAEEMADDDGRGDEIDENATQTAAVTPVRRVTPVPVRRTTPVPVRRIVTDRPNQVSREVATPVYTANGGSAVQRVARGEAAPNAATPVVIGPGRLDNRRASSLVAAISTRPGQGLSAPRIVSAPGLNTGIAASHGGSATGFASTQSSAPRPSFGMAAPSLGGMGGGAPSFADSAPVTIASRSTGGVTRFGGGSPSAPGMSSLPRIGGGGSPAAPRAPGLDLSPGGPAAPSLGGGSRLPSIGGAATAPAASPAAAPAVEQGPLVGLILHGIDPNVAARQGGPLAPLVAAGAPVTIVAAPGYTPDAAATARLKAMGIDLIVQAADRREVAKAAEIGAAGVQPVSDGRPVSMSTMRRFLSEAKADGLAIFSPSTGIGAAERLALNMGLPVIASSQMVEIRSSANIAVLGAALDRAAFNARQGRGGVVELWATPETVAAAAEWFAAAHSGAATAASLSMLVQAQR